MKPGFFLLGLLLFGGVLLAQNVEVQMDPLVQRLVNQYNSDQQAENTVAGWRVQILATTERQRLETVQQSFRYHYPNVPVDWQHSPPYYKLQAGAFKTKLDALRLKYILAREYEGLYLVRDDSIVKGELLNYF
ncbi:MAG: SPOR domain-containing protein [Bacteroidota bacterium]